MRGALFVLAACGFTGHGAGDDTSPDAPPPPGDGDPIVDGDPDAPPATEIPLTGCAPLAAIAPTVTNITELRDAVQNAQPGDVIAIADGNYDVGTGALTITTPKLTLRSASGNRTAVVITGSSTMTTIRIKATDVAVAALTVRGTGIGIRAFDDDTTTTTGAKIYDVHLVDNSTQIAVDDRANADDGMYADSGMIACSLLEMSDDAHACAGSNVQGIDASAARGWVVRDNRFANFTCSTHFVRTLRFDSGSRDTTIMRNEFHNCAGNIMFGGDPNSGDPVRAYQDISICGAERSRDGLICNNVIMGLDVRDFGAPEAFQEGIALWTDCGTVAAHNTIITPTTETFSVIEYRFAGTSVKLYNNLLQRQPKPRDMAAATGGGTIIYADPVVDFVDPRADVHIRSSTTLDTTGIDVGLVPAECRVDRDGKTRATLPTAGAYER